MTSKARRKIRILSLNALALIILLWIQDHHADSIVEQTSNTTEFQEVILHAKLILHNQSTYNWIAGVCMGLLVLNFVLYRQWVKSRKWILEPILILVISYGLAFSLYTYRTFELKDQLIEEKMKN